MNVVRSVLDELGAEVGAVAVREHDGRTTTRGELLGRTAAFCRRLVALGLQPGDRVVLLVPNGPLFAVTALAVLAAGGVPVLCDPGLGDEVFEAKVRAAAPRWAIVDRRIRFARRLPFAAEWLAGRGVVVPPIPSVEGMTTIEVTASSVAKSSALDRAVAVVERDAADDAMLVFTGGTTSHPKGVRLSHGALEAYLLGVGAASADLPISCFLADTPPQLLYALRIGKTAAIVNGSSKRRAAAIAAFIETGIVDSYFGSPYVFMQMFERLAEGERLPESLKAILLGSAPVTPSFLDTLRSRVAEGTAIRVLYGLTEIGPVCSVSAETKRAFREGGDLVGEALPHVEVRIEPDPAYPGEGLGEVSLRARSLYSGYLGETPLSEGEFLRTGDLGRVVEVEGRPMLVLAGRIKEMILRRGVNVYPSLYEPRILDDLADSIRGCALVGVFDSAREDESIVLFYEADAEIDRARLRAAVERITGPEAAPDEYVRVDAIPVTGRQNKIDRRALARMLAEGPRTAPESETGALLPFGFGTFARKLAWMVRAGAVGSALGSALSRSLLYVVAQTTWALDEIFDPEWRRTPMRDPVFVIGHQRSGTTFLHRVLASDEHRFTALALHEMVLPSLTAQRMLARVARVDRRLGAPLGRAFGRVEERLFGPLDDLHRIRFSEIEEDEFVFWGVFQSAMCVNDSPQTTGGPDLDDLRRFSAWSEARKRAVLGYHRACMRKKIHRFDPEARRRIRVVSKNPAFSHELPELRAMYPDAKFIHIVRDPRETIPSRLNLIRAIWRRRFPGFDAMEPAQIETIVADSLRAYESADRELREIPERSKIRVRYRDFVADPHREIAAIYRHFEWGEPPSSVRAAVETLARPTGSASEGCSPEEFGLDRSRLARAWPARERKLLGADFESSGDGR